VAPGASIDRERMNVPTARARPVVDLRRANSHLAIPILVIDDTAAKRLALRAVLAPLGYRVVEADSGSAGLRCLMAENFAVILLDVRMPIMDGFETAALIRLRRQSEMTPIIFVTANETSEIVADRYAEGAVDFITTPVRPHELRAKVSVFAHIFERAEAIAAQAREVQRSADQLRLVTESAPIGIFQTDAHNRYIHTNPRWSEITGIAAASAIGREWHSIFDDGDRSSAAAAFTLNPYGADFSSRLRLSVERSAPRIVLLTSKRVLDDDGGTTGWVGTLADVTAEAGAEAAMAEARDQATAASKLKSNFLANMSHEIRTPMNGVIGLTELLLETDLDDEQRGYAQTLSHSGDALMTVIDEILDFSKIESGKLEVEDIQFSLRKAVQDVAALMAPAAQTKGLRLRVADLDGSVPAVVSGDPTRLRQVLTNLMGNAIKFTHAGEVAVRVTAATGVDACSVLRFEVSDTGVGIGPDKLEIIFEPFTQADSSTTREYGGTGLGLTISKQLVGLMGGEMGLASEIGAGSTFWFTVPVQGLAGEATSGVAPADASFFGVRALVVESDAVQRAILTDFLTAWGMSVETAGSATAALAALHSAADEGWPIAIAFVDQSLHRQEGAALETDVLSDPVLDTRLVLMTKGGHCEDLAESEGNAPLSKPIRHDELLTCLTRALGRQHAADDVKSSDAEPSPSSEVPSKRLLLAEDNLINQTVALGILTRAGYQVDTVHNGREAVRAAASHHYEAILMDCHMPQMDGYEATAAIREREGSVRRTPIIALTAGARGEDRARCLAAGMDEHLSKPIRAEPLLRMLLQASELGVDAV
jgi:two-component system sensor histidine kinase/response regulator